MKERFEKRGCECCNWKGRADEILTAASPFDPIDRLDACPNCHEVNKVIPICDEKGCWNTQSCGTPTVEGYRSVCGKHYREIRKQKQQVKE